MKMFCFFVGFLLAACGELPQANLAPLTSQQPQVVQVLPDDGRLDYADLSVEVSFSKAIDPQTISEQSFLVFPLQDATDNAQTVWSLAKNDGLDVVKGHYEFLEENQKVRFVPDFPWLPGEHYGIFVAPSVMSPDRLPLNQTPGKNPQGFFSTFSTSQNFPSLEAIPARSPRPLYLFLNQIFYDAIGSDTDGDLFIELWGEPDKNLENYSLVFVNGGDGRLVGNLSIPKGFKTDDNGFFLMADAKNSLAGVSDVAHYDWVVNFDPPNGPDCIQLLNPYGELVDALGYGSPLVLTGENGLACYEGLAAPDVSEGKSLVRISHEQDFQNNSLDWEMKTPTK